MIRTKVYTAFNKFLHIEEAEPANSVSYRNAKLFVGDIALLPSSLIAYRANNQYRFQLEKVVANFFDGINPPSPADLSTISLVLQQASTTILKVQTSNANAAEKLDTFYPILLGKVPIDLFRNTQHDTLSAERFFLSNRENFQLVSFSQPIILSVLLNFDAIIDKLNVVATFHYEGENKTTVIVATQNLPTKGGVYRFTATLKKLLENPSLTISPDLPITQIDLSFSAQIDTENNSISPIYSLYPDEKTYLDEKTIIYLNSYGCYESARFTGEFSTEIVPTQETLINDGVERNINASFRKNISLQLGIDAAMEAAIIAENLTLSNKIFLLEGSHQIALVKDFKSFISYLSTNQYEGIVFNFKMPDQY